jgi:hypothetical protein
MDNLLKNKWVWIIGGFIFLIIVIAITGGNEEESVSEITQPQIFQEQQVQTAQDSKTNVQQKALFPVKELINKTPSEIETIIGQKLEIYGKKPSGKLMEAGFTLQGVDIWTVYTLIENPKVKYNGTILFQINFSELQEENNAWQIVDFSPPHKDKAIMKSDRRIVWENISGIDPFNKVDVWYLNGRIETLKFYLLSEEEETPLYWVPL